MARPPATDPLFAKNRRFLERTFPEVAAAVAGCGFEAGRLLAVGDDDWDLVRRDGSRLYGCGAREFAEKQAETFWARVEESRLSLPPPTNIAVDGMANGFVTECLRRAVDAGVQFFQQRCDNSAATVIVYGVGLGPHLAALVERSECEAIILVEPDAHVFFHSLFVFDWQTFVETVRGRGGDVGIMVAWDPGASAFTVMSWLNNRYPSLIDGTLFYTHYENPTLLAADREFHAKYRGQVAMGLGFIEDELLMIENSVRNLESFDGFFFRRGAPATEIPAFILGSGPSVDGAMETIGKFADRAIIVSCGTALEVLLRHGIVPDVHTALENVPAAYDVLARCSRNHHIRKVILIASTTVDPRIPPLFDTPILFNRAGVSSFPIFSLGEDTVLQNVAPMVSNLALAFAREAGCRRIFLFGVDLGTRDTALHHSHASSYMRGDLDYGFKNVLELEGNFGGVVHADYVYVQSKTVKEAEIARPGAGVEYFNCSDGARIEGAAPLQPGAVRIAETSQTKDGFKETMLAHFIRYDRPTFERQWSNRDLVRDLDAFGERLLAAVDEGGDGYLEVMRMLRRLTRLASTGDTWTRTTEEMLFRGTLCLSMRCVYFFLARTGNRRDRAILSALVKEGLGSLIGRMDAAIRAKYAQLGHP